MSALVGAPANAAVRDADEDIDTGEALGAAPVMFCVHNADKGEVSILHGTSEVIVTDRKLVRQILKAAGARQKS